MRLTHEQFRELAWKHGSLKQVPRRIQELQVTHFYKADPNYGTGVAKGLGLDVEKIVSSVDNMVAVG